MTEQESANESADVGLHPTDLQAHPAPTHPRRLQRQRQRRSRSGCLRGQNLITSPSHLKHQRRGTLSSGGTSRRWLRRTATPGRPTGGSGASWCAPSTPQPAAVCIRLAAYLSAMQSLRTRAEPAGPVRLLSRTQDNDTVSIQSLAASYRQMLRSEGRTEAAYKSALEKRPKVSGTTQPGRGAMLRAAPRLIDRRLTAATRARPVSLPFPPRT